MITSCSNIDKKSDAIDQSSAEAETKAIIEQDEFELSEDGKVQIFKISELII